METKIYDQENPLTGEEFKKIPDGKIFSQGITTNDRDGVFMTDTNKGENLKWMAVKGYADDWCIYIHWSINSWDFVKKQGDKVMSNLNIRKLVFSDKQTHNKYRY